MSKVGSKLANDADLRNHLTTFFSLVQDDEGMPAPGSAVSVSLFKGADRQYRMVSGSNFSVRPETRKAAVAAAQRGARLLGPIAGHERDVGDALWREAARRATTSPRPAVAQSIERLLTAIADDASRAFTHVTANRLCRLVEGVERLAIGPVTIAQTEAVAPGFQRDPTAKWRVVVGEGVASEVDGVSGRITFTLPPTCWIVECRAARRNLPEQSAWLVDIALSLLRIVHQDTPVMFPHNGEVESHPRSTSVDQDATLTFRDTDASWGAPDHPGIYEIGADLAAVVNEPTFQARADKIFESKPGSVGQRVAQGLGWLTRGRRSTDRAERLLHTFTALEALLSQSDKNAPVVQTLARHAAVILWADPAARAQGARQIRDLYAVRSALVHSGSRDVSQTVADTTQWLVEILFWHVLEQVGLDRKHEAFCTELAEASYGDAWPPTGVRPPECGPPAPV